MAVEDTGASYARSAGITNTAPAVPDLSPRASDHRAEQTFSANSAASSCAGEDQEHTAPRSSVRAARLEQIRSLLATGGYRVSSSRLADKLMEEMGKVDDKVGLTVVGGETDLKREPT